MPIESKELQIKAAVGNHTGGPTAPNPNRSDLGQMKQEIIKEVTEEVLRMIQLKLER